MSDDLALAERSVLGGALISRSAAEDVTSILRPTDFADWRHADIFAAIVHLVNGGKPADAVTVTDRLIETGDLTKIGGASLLHEMTSEVPTAANAGFYAEIVREASLKRRLHESVTRAAQTIAESGAGAWEIATFMRDDIERALDDLSGGRDVPEIGATFDDVMASLAEPPMFSPTPWPDVNDLIDGWRPGALYVIGGRPGGGKSLMGLMAAAGLAKHGPVAMSSLEMSTREITLRLVSALANVSLKALVRHAVQPHQWDAIGAARKRITDLALHIDDRGGVTLSDIRAHVRAVKRRGRLTAIVVDYLQLIRAEQSGRPRWEVVGEFTRELKAIAREYHVPVIALAQLNRESEGGVKRPTLADLRESGSIEQDADVVILLSRLLDPNTDEYGDEIEAIVAKNRHGQTGVATLFWEGHFARITDLSRWRDDVGARS